MLCENSKSLSMAVALAVAGGGRKLGEAKDTAKNFVGKAVQWAENFLGKDARVITNKAGDKIFRNADNTRRIRFDIANAHGDDPHMHVEIKQSSRWQDYTDQHRIYFNGE
jgi:hypothetical protein